MQDLLTSKWDKTWVLKEAETVCGYCNFRVIAGEGELMRIAVHGACRGRGYGRLLMERLLKEAEQENVADITLEVRASNAPAIALYEAYGFQKEAVRKNYYSDPMEDALIAELNERGERVIFLGDGVPVNRAVIEDEMKVAYSFAPAHVNRQRASAVAALGAVYLAEGNTETAAEHKPDYLRKSQAEREREVAERQVEMDKLSAGIVVVEKK